MESHLAHESECLRKTFLDCVSHELKTPLAAMDSMRLVIFG
jgi:K+-sensing histidine kinase KdpD